MVPIYSNKNTCIEYKHDKGGKILLSSTDWSNLPGKLQFDWISDTDCLCFGNVILLRFSFMLKKLICTFTESLASQRKAILQWSLSESEEILHFKDNSINFEKLFLDGGTKNHFTCRDITIYNKKVLKFMSSSMAIIVCNVSNKHNPSNLNIVLIFNKWFITFLILLQPVVFFYFISNVLIWCQFDGSCRVTPLWIWHHNVIIDSLRQYYFVLWMHL